MDKTEIFINMCEKAKEIQKRRPFLVTLHTVNIPEYDLKGNCWFNKNNKIFVWLPRQDQLQEMIVNPTLNISEFSKWALEAIENADYYMQFDSWEQLWLGFVMKKKFGKAWNGEEWE